MSYSSRQKIDSSQSRFAWKTVKTKDNRLSEQVPQYIILT